MSVVQDVKDIAQDSAQRLVANLPYEIVGSVFQHYKGPIYVVVAVTVDEARAEGKKPLEETLVHYYSISRKTRWTRTWADFFSFVGANDTPRFEYCRRATAQEIFEAFGLFLSAIK